MGHDMVIIVVTVSASCLFVHLSVCPPTIITITCGIYTKQQLESLITSPWLKHFRPPNAKGIIILAYASTKYY